MSRTKSSIKNIATGVGGQVINTILSFVNRSIFLSILGITYTSLNGLFMNILAVLSLAELGVGDAIIFSLYKPVAEGNKSKIKSLMKLYKKAYVYIGLVVGVVGILIIPFINYLVSEDKRVNNLILIYVLFLINSVISYFYAYKKSIILANQQAYINNIYTTGFNLLKSVLQIIFLIATKSFIIYLIIQIICTFLTNLFISKKADKLYKYLNEEAEDLKTDESKNIFENIKSLTIYKIGGIFLNSTDNIIITKFVGLDWVGYIANYNLIITSVNMILSQIFGGITASVGNLIATESDEKKYFMFRVINLINFWLFGFSSIAMLILSNDFINLWIGKDYILNRSVLIILIFNFYLLGMQNSIWVFRGATGMFKETKFIILITASLNIILSIFLSQMYGVSGVFLSTIISRLLTNVWYEPYILFKKYLHVSSKKYFSKFISNVILIIITYFFVNEISSKIYIEGFIGLFIKLIVVFSITNLIFLIFYFKKKELKYIMMLIKNLILKKMG